MQLLNAINLFEKLIVSVPDNTALFAELTKFYHSIVIYIEKYIAL